MAEERDGEFFNTVGSLVAECVYDIRKKFRPVTFIYTDGAKKRAPEKTTLYEFITMEDIENHDHSLRKIFDLVFDPNPNPNDPNLILKSYTTEDGYSYARAEVPLPDDSSHNFMRLVDCLIRTKSERLLKLILFYGEALRRL